LTYASNVLVFRTAARRFLGYNPTLKISILLHKTFCGVKFARRQQPVPADAALLREGMI
jgi:hypothetical protein